MLKLAKLLHSKGFYITFVNTEFNHRRLLKTQGPSALDGLPDFRFATIPDGLPPSDKNATQDIPSLCYSTMTTCLPHFRRLLSMLDGPPLTCIISDGVMTFTLDAAKELGIPEVLFWTTSACGFMSYLHYRHLMERGLVPLKGLTNMRLRDIPSFIRTTDPDDTMLNFLLHECKRATMASAIILNTFDELEQPVLDAMATILPPIYTIGPLTLLARQLSASPVSALGSNLWKEEMTCLNWLAGKTPKSVVYVNFGSITVMTNQQLIEFAWGLANSAHDFFWIIRPDVVKGDAAVLPQEFLEETKERGLLASWSAQEEILSNPAIGGFLTHSGWNSTVESISGGVPMLSWPFFAEQQTNCRYVCTEWGIGMEIDNNVKREVVEGMIRELMKGEKGKEMRKRAMEWKESAVRASQPGGPSSLNLERLAKEVLVRRKGA
ncbi:7-deoxyloganetin glucosyltransferase [Cocos nucifera]|nr:7-deoxyloganetin glucosyltransferase [Cocos nucifera]